MRNISGSLVYLLVPCVPRGSFAGGDPGRIIHVDVTWMSAVFFPICRRQARSSLPRHCLHLSFFSLCLDANAFSCTAMASEWGRSAAIGPTVPTRCSLCFVMCLAWRSPASTFRTDVDVRETLRTCRTRHQSVDSARNGRGGDGPVDAAERTPPDHG